MKKLILASLLSVVAVVGSTSRLPAQPADVDPRLVGTWYWESDSAYVPEGSTIIKSQRWVALRADGTFVVRDQGTQTGTRTYVGVFVSRGNVILARSDDGITLNVTYRLTGNNGLYLDGVLYQRVR